MKRQKTKKFDVIYDLNDSPITFDFAHFLVLADCVRQQVDGADNFQLTIRADNYRAITARDQVTQSFEKDWRVKNILLGCCSVLPTIKNVHLVKNFKEHNKKVYDWPKGYKANRPVGNDGISMERMLDARLGSMILAEYKKGAEPRVLEASPYAIAAMKRLLPERYITLTLRSSWIYANRNVELEEWYKFYKYLLSEGYSVVVIPDQEDYFSRKDYGKYDWVICDAACLNVELRIAAYSSAILNICSSNGPPSLMYYSHAKFLQFDQLRGGEYNENQWEAMNGFPVGGNFPWFDRLQRLVWKDSNFETLIEEYLSVSSHL